MQIKQCKYIGKYHTGIEKIGKLPNQREREKGTEKNHTEITKSVCSQCIVSEQVVYRLGAEVGPADESGICKCN